MSAVSRAIRAAAAKVTASDGGGGDGDAILTASILNPILEQTGGAFEVVHVTNTNNSGPGSIVDAVQGGSSSVARIVVFDVSGACFMPTVTDPPSYDVLFIGRSNLYVAGQTAPAGPDGRGFTVYGGLGSDDYGHIVLEHIVFSPQRDEWNGSKNNNANARFSYGTNTENIIIRNCTFKNTLDTSIQFSGSNGLFETGGRNIVFVNNLLAQPGLLSNRSDYYGAHGYTIMVNPRTYRFLGAYNLLANGAMRTPLLATGSHTAWVNNYFWDFGGPNAEGWASEKMGYPVFLDIRGDGGSDNWWYSQEASPSSWSLSNPNYIIADIVSNHYEGGPSTRIPLYYRNDEDGFLAQYMISVTSAEDYDPMASGGPSDWGHHIHLRDNRVETRFDQHYPDAFPDDIAIDSQTTYVGTVTDYDGPTSQPSDHITFETTWRYTLPFTPVPWKRVRDICLAYAGAHPANREPDDARIIGEITNRTHAQPHFVNGMPPPMDAVTETTSAADVPEVGTGDTGTLSGSHALVTGYDGEAVTQLEQWLHAQHMTALGIPSGAADYDPNIAGLWIAETTEAAV